MRIFKNAWFERFARKQHISDVDLHNAIERAEKGQIDADLGSGVIKQRLTRKGQGRSGPPLRLLTVVKNNGIQAIA